MMTYDATLEEMWRIKERLSAPQVSWEEYAASLYAFQEEERKRGVKFVTLPLRNPEKGNNLFVAEAGIPYRT